MTSAIKTFLSPLYFLHDPHNSFKYHLSSFTFSTKNCIHITHLAWRTEPQSPAALNLNYANAKTTAEAITFSTNNEM